MKKVLGCTGRGWLCLLSVVILSSVLAARAEVQSGQVSIKYVRGTATYANGGAFQPLHAGSELGRGATRQCGPDGAVDLVLQYNGTVLRLLPNSTLSFDKLDKELAGEQVITETSVKLIAGRLIGSQRKLATPSTFRIAMADGLATIKGTEYLVRADGAVTVLSGSVKVIYNLPNGMGSIQVEVAAGYSFDPATGKVVKTTADFLQNIVDDVKAVQDNARVFKVDGTTVVVKPERVIAPTRPHGNNA